MHKRALLSVSDKSGLMDLAQRLHALGIELIATGGTEKTLREAGIPVTSVESITQFPECFSGRVKTMHPKITGAVLYRRDDATHAAEAQKLGIDPIDIVIVNLYPFAQTMRDASKSREDVMEQIDIGGPTLLRSAAKNHASVTVVCDPAEYDALIEQLERDGDTSPAFRAQCAAKVFLHTAAYDALITQYLSDGANSGVILANGNALRYGENPHQSGRYYDRYDADVRDPTAEDTASTNSGPSVKTPRWGVSAPRPWRQLQGKELSYLNILDADGAWTAVTDFAEPTVVMVKHANPCGIASDTSIDDAFRRAYDADRLSAFGVIIALNRPCTARIAQMILEEKMFVEVIIAPSYEDECVDLLKQKTNLRLIDMRDQKTEDCNPLYRSALGGMLAQESDHSAVAEKDLTVVTSRKPTPEQVRDLLFAWTCVKHTKSNAIVFAKDRTTVGIGAGQTSRVDATWIAAKRAGEKAAGAVMASDAFFPFPDSVEEAAKHGIVAVIQPGGSVRDAEVFARAEELGLVMVTTGVRAFWH